MDASLGGVAALPTRSRGLSTLAGVMAARTKEDVVAKDGLLGAFLVASIVVVLVGWATVLIYIGFRFL
jgi:hypothetical protein